MKRSLLRDLALPFVFTSAFAPSAFGDSAPPEKPPTTAPIKAPINNPPGPRTPTANPPAPKLPKAPDGANVMREPDGSCWLHSGGGHCPPGAHCNPPPPRQVECPPEKAPSKKK